MDPTRGKKTRPAGSKTTPTVLFEEDLLTQVEKISEPLPHPYTAAPTRDRRGERKDGQRTI
jgi:hypothetical protein